MDALLGILLAIQLTAGSLYLIRREIRKTGEWVSPTIVLLAFAVLDVFLSGIRILAAGRVDLPWWMAPLSAGDVVSGMLWFTIGTLALLLGIGWASGSRANEGAALAVLDRIEPRVRRLYLCLGVAIAVYLDSLIQQIGSVGSVAQFISARAASRYTAESVTNHNTSTVGLLWTYLNSASLTVILMLVGVLFFCRVRYRKELFWGIVLPVVAWVCVATTFYRGSQLYLFVSLLGLETTRLRATSPRGRRRTFLTKTRLRAMMIAPAVFFLSYGALRTFLSDSAVRRNASIGSAISQQADALTQGASLVGMAEISKTFPSQRPYLGGSTILGSLLLPVPRSMWHGKADVTGFLSISRTMGWAESTQSAVSWPGEFYANFGPIGLLLLIFVGMSIGFIYRIRLRPTAFFVYMYSLIPGLMVSHWMSMLGLMNSLVVVPLVYGVGRMVIGLGPSSVDYEARGIVEQADVGIAPFR